MTLNLAWILEATSRRHSQEPAIQWDGKTLTHAELADLVRRVSAALQVWGLGPGDRVAILCPNRPEFTLLYFAILHAGGTVVPLNPLFVASEVAYHLEDSGAAFFFAWWEQLEKASAAVELQEPRPRLISIHPLGSEPGPGPQDRNLEDLLVAQPGDWPSPTRPDDTAVLLYTSGTTGRPKGAELTHFNLWSNAQWSSERAMSAAPHQIQVAGPGCLALCALPLFHSFGQSCVQNGLLFNGGAIAPMSRWDPDEALRRLETFGCTHFSGVPTMYFGLLHSEELSRVRLPQLRFASSGGAAMPVEIMKEFEERFPVRIMEGYGLSETSPVATFHTPGIPRKLGSVGVAIDGCEVRIFDGEDQPVPAGEAGEVVIRGQNIMKGYWQRPEATADALRGNWFHSGDVGRMDEDGYLYIVDRTKDMIIRGGFNVYPREVEEVLYGHPAVREAAVVGVPDREYGEEIVAVLALREGQSASPTELIAYCKERVAAYKYPRRVEFRDQLPRGGTGKILKRALREELVQP